ncbi:MAG: glycosyltransferase family 2 protein [Lachnospiraceae bacterium]|nr:glycosyltransferase family 2 protein [Lachnospiraceae bacterium]
MNNNKLVSFVIPSYCSQNTISDVVDEINSTMKRLAQYHYEIVLVDDASKDQTFDIIKNLVSRQSNIRGLRFAKNFGQHAALMAGIRESKGDYIVCLDDDGQTPANEVGKLLEKLDEGYDAVYASYEKKEHSFFRNIGSKVNSKMTEIMLDKPHNLYISSYFAIRRFVADEMARYECSYPYVIGLVLRSTRNICNVPVHHRSRKTGHSGYTLGKLIKLWMNGFTAFSVKPLRVASVAGALIALAGFVYLIYIVVHHFLTPDIPMGWSSIICTILILGGFILLVLGLIGEYVGRIYISLNAAPQYVIRERIVGDNNEEKNK